MFCAYCGLPCVHTGTGAGLAHSVTLQTLLSTCLRLHVSITHIPRPTRLELPPPAAR